MHFSLFFLKNTQLTPLDNYFNTLSSLQIWNDVYEKIWAVTIVSTSRCKGFSGTVH